jgi:uncharacterized protein (TIGR04145 family)
MKIKAKLIISVCVIITMLVSSFPVLAAEGDGVIFINAAAAGSEVGITIDGSFTDWEDKAELPFPIYYDAGTKHGGILYRDSTYVYLYIQMAPSGYSQFQGYSYNFTVDGKGYSFDVVPVSGSIGNGNTTMKIIRVNGYQVVDGASGVVHRSTSNYFPTADYPVGDQMEMRIPLTFFYKQPETLVTIKFNSPNLGTQTLTATGTPTMPFILAAAGLLVASFGYFLLKRKRSR